MKRVLIVEDQRMPRENMERTLSDSGEYALAASVNGADVAFWFKSVIMDAEISGAGLGLAPLRLFHHIASICPHIIPSSCTYSEFARSYLTRYPNQRNSYRLIP